PSDFFSSGATVTTNGSTYTQGGLQQALKWGGGNYTVTFDGSRGTQIGGVVVYPLSLKSDFNAVVNQPLLRNFKIDATRVNIGQAKLQQKITDLALQQRVTQTALNVRSAYYNLLGQIAGLQVAQESYDLSKRSLKDNQTRVEVGTMAKIDIVQAEAEVASNEEAVIVQEAGIQRAEDQLRALVMNPSQPGFWTTTFNPIDQATNAPRSIDIDLAVKNALENRTDILQLKRQIDQNDLQLKYAQNQKLP